MPRRKTPPRDLTDEEVMKKLFPKKARDKAKKEAENPRSTGETSIKKKSK